MPSLFALLRKVLADRRAEPRVGSEYAVELIVGITAGGEQTTLFSHTLDVSRGGLAVFIPRVEAGSFITGGDSPSRSPSRSRWGRSGCSPRPGTSAR